MEKEKGIHRKKNGISNQKVPVFFSMDTNLSLLFHNFAIITCDRINEGARAEG